MVLRVRRTRDLSEGLLWEEEELKRGFAARVERRRKEEGVGRDGLLSGGSFAECGVVVVDAKGEEVRWTGLWEEVRASAAAADR